MSDRWAVVLAVATCAGAWAAIDGPVGAVPLSAGLAVLALAALLGRATLRPELLCLAAALLAAALAHRSLTGLAAPLATGPVAREVVLVGDPAPAGPGAVTADVRLDGRRLRATARGSAAAALDDRLAGERVDVTGTVARPGRAEALLRHRHLAGRLDVEVVRGWRPGGPVSRAANGLRRTLAAGAASLPERHRSLLAGVTLGDDRAQPADMTDAFRAAGLTHLLAVSGQNVAFALVVATPVLTRLRFGPRLAATLAVLAGFALLTRAEPSVLRATAMAGVAAVGTALGRPASTLRTLALGVTGVVLVDPLLVTSLGFRLSVAGAAGIVVGAGRLSEALPGPRWLAMPLAVTLSAQAAVSPLLVAAFGSVPVGSLPANLVAVPVAGPIMVWGLTAGLVAGVVGGRVAWLLHLPTRAMLTWLDGVATAAARWPLGDLRAGHLAALALAAAALLAARSRLRATSPTPPSPAAEPIAPVAGQVAADPPPAAARRQGRLLVTGAVTMALVAGLTALVPAPVPTGLGPTPLGPGATLWQAGGATVVQLDGRARDTTVLAGLRSRRVTRLDVVVLRTPARAAAAVAAVLRSRWPAAAILAPTVPARDVPDLDVAIPPSGTVLDVGGLRLTVHSVTADRLDVTIVPGRAGTPASSTSRTPRGDSGRSPDHGAIGVGGRPPSPRERRTDPHRLGAAPATATTAAARTGAPPRAPILRPWPSRPPRRCSRCRPSTSGGSWPAPPSTCRPGRSWWGWSGRHGSGARARWSPRLYRWRRPAPTSSTCRCPDSWSAPWPPAPPAARAPRWPSGPGLRRRSRPPSPQAPRSSSSRSSTPPTRPERATTTQRSSSPRSSPWSCTRRCWCQLTTATWPTSPPRSTPLRPAGGRWPST